MVRKVLTFLLAHLLHQASYNLRHPNTVDGKRPEQRRMQHGHFSLKQSSKVG